MQPKNRNPKPQTLYRWTGSAAKERNQQQLEQQNPRAPAQAKILKSQYPGMISLASPLCAV